jgi:hypothetical protein
VIFVSFNYRILFLLLNEFVAQKKCVLAFFQRSVVFDISSLGEIYFTKHFKEEKEFVSISFVFSEIPYASPEEVTEPCSGAV